jgi:hypothetical protein
MSAARDVLNTIRNLSAAEFLSLASILGLRAEDLFRLTTPPATGPVDIDLNLPKPRDLFNGDYGLELTGIGDRAIQAIKVTRELTGFGLKESKDIVDAVRAGSRPIRILQGLALNEAQDYQARFHFVGTASMVVYTRNELPF